MTVVGPPFFFDFIMSLNDEQADSVMETRRMMNGGSTKRTGSTRRSRKLIIKPKKKRKVSAYQKEFGRQLKALKKKHPKTPVSRLMKRAHIATRKARK